MKKLISVSLAIIMIIGIFAFAGCGGKQETADNGNTNADKPAGVVKVIDIDITDEEYAFGVDSKQPELLAKTNEFIKKIMADGTFDAICEKYFGDGTPTPVKSAKLDTSKDQLVVATNAEFAPFEYTQGDAYCGIDMEIADLLAKELGKELVISNMEFNAVILSVSQQKCDIAMAGLTVTEERAKQVSFTESYYKASQRLIVKSDDTKFDACKTKEDVEAILNGFDSSVTIGVQNATTGEGYVTGSEDLGFAGLKTKSKAFSSGSLAVQDMINGNVDYVIIDAAPAASIAKGVNAVA